MTVTGAQCLMMLDKVCKSDALNAAYDMCGRILRQDQTFFLCTTLASRNATLNRVKIDQSSNANAS